MFGQIIATLPFYIRAYFDIGRYSVNKSTIGRPPKYRDYHEIKKFSSNQPQKYWLTNNQPTKTTTNNQQGKA